MTYWGDEFEFEKVEVVQSHSEPIHPNDVATHCNELGVTVRLHCFGVETIQVVMIRRHQFYFLGLSLVDHQVHILPEEVFAVPQDRWNL